VVLDCDHPRQLAEFYRQFFGLSYREGDEPPPPGEPDPRGEDWLVLRGAAGSGLAFQRVENFESPTWPSGPRPQQLHLDTTVETKRALVEEHDRVLGLGGRLLYDRLEDPEEPLRVYADPAGHPFCIFVAPQRP
jgi:hypothetical protein